MCNACNVPPDEHAIVSSDYESTYDSTYETNHSDSSDFAQNDEEGEGGKKPPEAKESSREYLADAIIIHPLLPSPEVGKHSQEESLSYLSHYYYDFVCFRALQRP